MPRTSPIFKLKEFMKIIKGILEWKIMARAPYQSPISWYRIIESNGIICHSLSSLTLSALLSHCISLLSIQISLHHTNVINRWTMFFQVFGEREREIMDMITEEVMTCLVINHRLPSLSLSLSLSLPPSPSPSSKAKKVENGTERNGNRSIQTC